MIKYLLLSLISLNLFAQSSPQKTSGEDTPNLTGIELDRQAKPSKDVFEYGYSYVSFGQGILSTKDLKGKASQLTAGYTRFAEEIMYGINYNRYELPKKIIADGLNASVGFSTTKVMKIKPSISFDFGFANVQNKIIATKSSGLYSGLNIGVQLSESLPFHFLTGMKFGKYSMNDDSSVLIHTLYFSIGFEF